MRRRTFLKYSLLSTALSARPGVLLAKNVTAPSVPREEMTITELQQLMVDNHASARDICQYYLNRIQSIDKQGPALNSIIELNPDALQIADQLDIERKRTGSRGPLHGIPLLLKDNIDTGDRMQTTAGSLALLGETKPQDAFLVQKLRKAGAIILGKTNLSEWANFRSTRSSSGWSSRGGQTRNPYALRRNPCGSSSGSGAAVAANLCAATIGTETDGSIICPSSNNGIVGIKPTVGLVSRTGIIPIAHSQDTAGPMARTVTDAAIVLNIIRGMDPEDNATHVQKNKPLIDYRQFLIKNGLQGARIGVARNFLGFDVRVDAIMETSCELMKKSGAEIIDPANIDGIHEYEDSEYEVLLYEFKADLNAYLKRRSCKEMKTLADIIAFNEMHKNKVMPYFGQEIFLAAQEKGPLTDKIYLDALKKNLLLSRNKGIDASLKAHQLDAIIAPSGGPSWLTDLINGDHFSGSSSTPAAVAGYPSITVPAGFIHGLPVGLSFIGGAYTEAKLIQYAYAFEQASLAREPPRFVETLPPA